MLKKRWASEFAATQIGVGDGEKHHDGQIVERPLAYFDGTAADRVALVVEQDDELCGRDRLRVRGVRGQADRERQRAGSRT
jgi:hypothetical protein